MSSLSMKKKSFLLTVVALSSIGLIGYSKDEKSEPENPGDVVESKYLSEEDYENKVANRMWIPTSSKWMDKDGNELPYLKNYIGFEGPSAIYFLPQGYIYFAYSSHAAIYCQVSYNSLTGLFAKNPANLTGDDIQILSLEDGVLYLRTDKGRWIDETNPDAVFDESVWRYYTLEEEKDPNMDACSVPTDLRDLILLN